MVAVNLSAGVTKVTLGEEQKPTKMYSKVSNYVILYLNNDKKEKVLDVN